MLFKQPIIKSRRYIILLARCNIFVKNDDSGFFYNLLLLRYLPYILTTIIHFYLRSLS